MKYIYLVDYWVPFPSSEYGGIINVIAENDQECFDILTDKESPETVIFDSKYEDRIMTKITNAPRFALAESEESKIVDIFVT